MNIDEIVVLDYEREAIFIAESIIIHKDWLIEKVNNVVIEVLTRHNISVGDNWEYIQLGDEWLDLTIKQTRSLMDEIKDELRKVIR